MEQENNKETSESAALHSNECTEKLRVKQDQMPNEFNKPPMIVNFLVILFLMAGIYAIYDISTSDVSKSDEKIIGEWYDVVDTSLSTTFYDISTSDVSKSDEKIIGKWYDVVDASIFYELYEKNGKTYLNYSGVRIVECEWRKIKEKKYVFRNERSEIFNFEPETFVYIGKDFEEECVDENGNRYNSDIILLQQGNTLVVYSNNYDKKIYDILCTAYKR